MSSSNTGTAGKNRTWIYLIAAFAVLALIGVLTS